jgi:hypothetical protein
VIFSNDFRVAAKKLIDIDQISCSASWPLNTSCLLADPYPDWILAIIDPVTWLSIPKNEVRKFQLFVVLTLDLIWFCRNKLVHEAILPSPNKVLLHLSSSVTRHLSAWKDVALPSLWVPP